MLPTLHYCIATEVGLVVLAVDYRLGPEDPYPAAAYDARDVLLWVVANGKKELGVDTARIGLGGSSRSVSPLRSDVNQLFDVGNSVSSLEHAIRTVN